MSLLTCKAQKPSKILQRYLVEGYVIDQKTSQTMEFATICLVDKDDPDQIQGFMTDSSGFFIFNETVVLIISKQSLTGLSLFQLKT